MSETEKQGCVSDDQLMQLKNLSEAFRDGLGSPLFVDSSRKLKCRYRLTHPSVVVVRRRRYVMDKSSKKKIYDCLKTSDTLVWCRRAFQVPRQTDSARSKDSEEDDEAGGDCMVVLFPVSEFSQHSLNPPARNPSKPIPLFKAAEERHRADPFLARERGLDYSSRTVSSALATPTVAAATGHVGGAGDEKDADVQKAAKETNFEDRLFGGHYMRVTVCHEAKIAFSKKFLESHFEEMSNANQLRRSLDGKNLYFNLRHPSRRRVVEVYLTGDYTADDASYKLVHPTNQLLVMSGTRYLPLPRAKSEKEQMELVSAKTRTRGSLACTIGLSRTEDREGKFGGYRLTLIPVRETGRSVDYGPTAFFPLMETPADSCNPEDGRLERVSETTTAFPGSLADRAVDYLVASKYLRRDDAGYSMEKNYLTAYEMLQCHVEPLPTEAGAEATLVREEKTTALTLKRDAASEARQDRQEQSLSKRRKVDLPILDLSKN